MPHNDTAAEPLTGFFALRFPPDFPVADVATIGARLAETGGVVPGFHAPAVGMLDLRAILYMREVEGWDFHLLPDRNLVTRMAAIAQHGAPLKSDKPTSMAINLMAFCQAMDIQIEPSIAFHELAHREGNDKALTELSWFRPADHNNARAWIDLAMGRKSGLTPGAPVPVEPIDLALPLRRWRRNYIVLLKLAELALAEGEPIEKAKELLRWMHEDFMLAGPAATFSLLYLAPKGSLGGLKKLKSPDRDKAIAGIRNAAWDITQLSDFVLRMSRSEAEQTRFLFATADEGLASIAPAVISSIEPAEGELWLGSFLEPGWGTKAATELVASLRDYIERENDPGRPPPDPRPDFISICIGEGEASVRSWTPT